MANASPFSPTKKHFFKPLLHGFQSHLEIPEKFFSDHIEGKHEANTVKLRTDASERTWKVKMEGNKLTEGWKEFVEAHDLRIGDFVVFRHEENMLFHVTALGPSCCEIQYSDQSSSHEEDEESDETDSEISSRSEKEVEETMQKETDLSSSDLNCFSQYVTASNIITNRLGVPKDFAKQNGFVKERQEIVLMNEQGKSWESEVMTGRIGQVFIVGGWKSFCTENKLEAGDCCTFRLLPNTKTPVFRLCSRTNAERKKKKIRADEDFIDENRFWKLAPTPNSLEAGRQHLPARFAKVNGLINPGEIILVDKNGDEWLMKLKVDNRGAMYIIGGNDWRSFFDKNEVGAGESLTLELIRGGTSPLLKFCSKMEHPPLEAEDGTHKRARVQTEVREKRAAEGEPSQAPNKSSGNQRNLQHTQPCSVSDQVAKVKQNVVDTLTSIRQFLTELETMERKLEDSLQEFNNLERGERQSE